MSIMVIPLPLDDKVGGPFSPRADTVSGLHNHDIFTKIVIKGTLSGPWTPAEMMRATRTSFMSHPRIQIIYFLFSFALN